MTQKPVTPLQPASGTRVMVPAMLADTEYLFHQAKEGSGAFLDAKPFPHLHLSLIKSSCCEALFEGLVSSSNANPDNFYPQSHVLPVVRMLLWELSSSTLIRHFTTLTGKPPLLPDPFLINSGIRVWHEPLQTHVAEQEFFSRHPENGLENALRLELFVSNQPSATFAIELINAQGTVEAEQIGRNGTVLFMNSNHYHVRYRNQAESAKWCSVVAYYYVNDRARAPSEIEKGGY